MSAPWTLMLETICCSEALTPVMRQNGFLWKGHPFVLLKSWVWLIRSNLLFLEK